LTIQTFLESLGDKLRLLGVDEANIKKHLYMFEKYLSSLGSDELEETLSDEDQLDVIAVNIYKLIKKKAEKAQDGDGVIYSESASDVTSSADVPEDGAYPDDADVRLVSPETDILPDQGAFDTADDADDDMKTFDFPSPTETAPAASTSASSENSAADAPRSDVSGDSSDNAETKVIDVIPHIAAPMLADSDIAGTRVIDAVKPIPDSPANTVGTQDTGFDEFDDFTENVPGSPKFWVIFFATLPVSLAVMLLILTVFGVLFAASAVLIVGLIASLIALVGGGTALSLIGIIYGITQTVITLPIGLYEIGMGVTIGGATMLCGILIYNFAVRLLPFLLRKLVSLLAFVFGRLRGLFYRLKRESAKK